MRAAIEQPEPQPRSELRNYLIGFALAVVLTLGAFSAALAEDLPQTVVRSIVGALALLQIVVHVRFFLHIDLSRQKREDLQLILFSVLLLVLMAGGMVWIIFNLYRRMLPNAMP